MQQLKGRVAIDVTRQFRRIRDKKIATGIDKVDLAYIQQFQSNAQALLRLKKRWFILNEQDSALLFNKLLNNMPCSKFEVFTFCARSYLQTSDYPSVMINTSHSGLEQSEYAIEANKLFKKVAYFLHDIIPLEYPEYCRQGEFAKHQQRMQTILDSGSLVIGNSADTINRFQDYLKSIACNTTIESTYALLGVDKIEATKQLPQFPVPKTPYFMVLGTIEPRKNHLLLLQVWRRLQEQLGDKCPDLYIVGKRGWDIEQVIDILDRASFAQKNIVEISNASDDQVSHLIKNAAALLFPSFTEGFGLPLVQALQLSTPVIASDLMVFRELAGDIPEYIDPIDVLQWLKIITNYTVNSNGMRADQMLRMAQFQLYTWEQHFDVVTPELNKLFVS